MINTTQILTISVVVILTLVLSVIGFQVFLILREFQKTVQKMNKMLDDFGLVSESVAKPVAALADHFTGLASIAGLFGLVAKKRREKAGKETENE
jgi:branched-subunit amino acid transport protein AzlD